MPGDLTDLAKYIRELDQVQVLKAVDKHLGDGVSPMAVVGALQKGMAEVGEAFAKGEVFLSELIMCGEIMKQVMEKLEPLLVGENPEYKGTVVIGTVKGDIHDLGKNIVIMLLKGAGYNVIDLGVDVPEQKFIEALKESKAPLVGMSVMLTACQDAMKETIKAIKDAGLHDVKVLIGGNYVDEKVKEYCGADYFGTSADVAVKVADEVCAG